MPKIASSILLTILLLFSPSLSAQEETEQLQMQAFKWFPEGNYSGITYLNLTSAESRPEMKLFRQYWNIYGDYDPFDNFLPWPLEQYKVKVFANVARFGISKLTSEGAKQLRDNLRAGVRSENREVSFTLSGKTVSK